MHSKARQRGLEEQITSYSASVYFTWQVPWLAFISLAIILVSWCAGVRLPGGVPGGLAAVVIGTILG